MNVLLVGLDDSLLTEAADSDTRKRHVAYASTLAQQCPGSHLHMVVHSPSSDGLQRQVVSEHLTVYPTRSRHRYLFALDIFRIGRRIHRRHGLDLVTTQTPFDDGVAGYLLARRYGVPYLAQLRPTNLDDPYWLRERRLNHLLRRVGRWLVPRADGVRVVSEASRQWCMSELGVDEDRLFLNQIAMSMLAREDRDDVERDPQSVLYVGRLASEKGLPYLLKAFSSVREAVPDATLTLVGDGPERDALESTAVELGLGDAVTFEGAVPYEQVPEYYRRAGVLALPSLHENFGRVILEAFSFGTPAVVTDTEGPRELVVDGDTGYVVPKADATALSDAIETLLTDVERQRTVGESARRFVDDQFDYDRLVEDTVSTWVTVGDSDC